MSELLEEPLEAPEREKEELETLLEKLHALIPPDEGTLRHEVEAVYLTLKAQAQQAHTAEERDTLRLRLETFTEYFSDERNLRPAA